MEGSAGEETDGFGAEGGRGGKGGGEALSEGAVGGMGMGGVGDESAKSLLVSEGGRDGDSGIKGRMLRVRCSSRERRPRTLATRAE